MVLRLFCVCFEFEACHPMSDLWIRGHQFFSLCSYVVGSPGQQMPDLDRENRPVTLEYQDTVEQQMTEVMYIHCSIY